MSELKEDKSLGLDSEERPLSEEMEAEISERLTDYPELEPYRSYIERGTYLLDTEVFYDEDGKAYTPQVFERYTRFNQLIKTVVPNIVGDDTTVRAELAAEKIRDKLQDFTLNMLADIHKINR